ncbi:MAG: EAL domain-containing protein [Pseudomonadota bacterium]|nr:EAL domain-containing protein [Pseudomonadota bacterium]
MLIDAGYLTLVLKPGKTTDLQKESLASAHRDAIVLTVLISAVMLLIWNGSDFFHQLSFAGGRFGADVQLTSTALTLNVALILFGWRRYVDLQQEAEKRAEGEVRAAVAASTDAITGLLNRKGFADKAQNLCGKARQSGDQVAVLSLQVHRFKSVNDRYGYEVGDMLLRCISASLTEILGDRALIARLSGDEFAVAFTICPGEDKAAQTLGEQILHAVTRPFDIENRVIQVGAFAGIVTAATDDVDVPDLLRRADIAMDHAHNGRVARPVWFDSGMEQALVAHGEIEEGIRFGLEHEQFVPYFEPQVDLRTGRIVGFEVLARWKHPLSGIIGPDVFIPVAEEIGLIGRLSEQVIRAALTDAAKWDPSIHISVNISPHQLSDGWLAERIVRLLTETGFPADRLVIEITESSLFADIDLARSIATSLKNQGIQLALDDFGTGFSSLSHLRSLPFDVIKIDRSFVTNVHRNRESAAIIRAVTTLASGLDVPVSIEGIETDAARVAVLGLGCSVAQGWFFGKPMTAEQAAEHLARSVANDAPGDPVHGPQLPSSRSAAG